MFLEKIFKKNHQEKSGRESGLRWFPIWEDEELLSRIRFSLYKANPKYLRTETRINLKLVEYKTEIEESVIPEIPLRSVSELMDKFEITTLQDLLSISPSNFQPKIVKIENPIAIMVDALLTYEVQIEQIERRGMEEAKSLREKLEKLKREDDFKLLQELHSDLYNIMKNNKEIRMDAIFESGKRRKPDIRNFLGKEYCLLMSHYGQATFNEEKSTATGGNMLPIFIPRDGFNMLPYGEMFMGRVLGVIYLNPQPIFKNLGPGFCLIVASVSVPMHPEILNR